MWRTREKGEDNEKDDVVRTEERRIAGGETIGGKAADTGEARQSVDGADVGVGKQSDIGRRQSSFHATGIHKETLGNRNCLEYRGTGWIVFRK